MSSNATRNERKNKTVVKSFDELNQLKDIKQSKQETEAEKRFHRKQKPKKEINMSKSQKQVPEFMKHLVEVHGRQKQVSADKAIRVIIEEVTRVFPEELQATALAEMTRVYEEHGYLGFAAKLSEFFGEVVEGYLNTEEEETPVEPPVVEPVEEPVETIQVEEITDESDEQQPDAEAAETNTSGILDNACGQFLQAVASGSDDIMDIARIHEAIRSVNEELAQSLDAIQLVAVDQQAYQDKVITALGAVGYGDVAISWTQMKNTQNHNEADSATVEAVNAAQSEAA